MSGAGRAEAQGHEGRLIMSISHTITGGLR